MPGRCFSTYVVGVIVLHCEQVFRSKISLNKSMLRTEINDTALETLMRLSMADDDGVGLDDFDFESALASWSNAARGR